MLTKAQKEGNKRYLSKFDDIKIRVPAGQREQLKAYAEAQGKSLNQLIIDLLVADMAEHGQELN